MVDAPLGAQPHAAARLLPVRGPEDRTPTERALAALADAPKPATEVLPERLVLRLAVTRAQEAATTFGDVSANLQAVRDQLEALRELVIAGRLEARAVAAPATVALPDAVASLVRTIRASVAAAVPAPPAPEAAPPTTIDTALAPPTGETGLLPPAGETSLLPPTGETALVPPSGETALAPASGETALVPPSGETGLVPPAIDTALAVPSGETGLVPPTVDTALAVPSGVHGLVPGGVDTALAVPSGEHGLVPAGVETSLAPPSPAPATAPGVASAALLVTHDPTVEPSTLLTDGVPAALQQRSIVGERAGVGPAESQALLVGGGNALQHAVDELAGLPPDDAIQVVDAAIAEVERARTEAAAEVDRAMAEALPVDPPVVVVGTELAVAMTDELRISVPQQALASMAAAVAGLDRRQVERLLVDVPVYAASVARERSPRPIMAMSATAARA